MNNLAWIKLTLVAIGALSGAISAHNHFSDGERAWAGVIAATSAAMLAYILKPPQSAELQDNGSTPVEVINPPDKPIPTTDQPSPEEKKTNEQ